MSGYLFPRANVPVLDDRTGQFTRDWYLYQQSLYGAAGNGTVGTSTDVLHGGGAGWGKVVLTTDVSGILPVGNGGTGIAFGSSGGVPYFSAVNTMASSAALSTNQIVLGGGVGGAPSTPLSLGTTTTVLHGNAAGAPTWGSVSLAADVTGTLPVGNGGTGITVGTSGGVLGFTASGTIASSAALTANALVVGGGPGVTPSTPVGLGTTVTVLHGNAGGAPTWGAVSLTTDVTGTLQAGQAPAFSGDVTSSAGSLTLTLATVVAASTNTKITYNAKGLVTGGAQAAASDLSNGTTGSGAIALAASPTFTGTVNLANVTASGQINAGSSATTIGKAALGTTGAIQLLVEDTDQADASYPFAYLQASGGSTFLGVAKRSGTGITGAVDVLTLSNTLLTVSTSLKVSSLGAFAAGDKYVIADASGNFHISSLGPAS